MYELPTLLRTAYYACNQEERNKFDLLEVPDVGLQTCCAMLFEFLKIDKNQNEGNDRQSMFSRSQFRTYDHGFNYICEIAASRGHIGCMKFAHEVGVPWDSKSRIIGGTVCDAAVKRNSLECLKYAFENGCCLSAYTCSWAAKYGYLECLVYARKNGGNWNEMTCTCAAMYGHLDCLIYARKNGCPWNERTCFGAALNGHLDCFDYARKNGCPWDKEKCKNLLPTTYL